MLRKMILLYSLILVFISITFTSYATQIGSLDTEDIITDFDSVDDVTSAGNTYSIDNEVDVNNNNSPLNEIVISTGSSEDTTTNSTINSSDDYSIVTPPRKLRDFQRVGC